MIDRWIVRRRRVHYLTRHRVRYWLFATAADLLGHDVIWEEQDPREETP